MDDDQERAERLARPVEASNPSHYRRPGVSFEVIDVLKAQMSRERFLGFLQGNSIKYLLRCEHKGTEAEDVKKAKWYTDYLNREEEGS